MHENLENHPQIFKLLPKSVAIFYEQIIFRIPIVFFFCILLILFTYKHRGPNVAQMRPECGPNAAQMRPNVAQMRPKCAPNVPQMQPEINPWKFPVSQAHP